MTYLETPIFGELISVNNKKLNKLIEVPSKYIKKNNPFKTVIIAILILPIIFNMLFMEIIKKNSLMVLILFSLLIFIAFISKIIMKLIKTKFYMASIVFPIIISIILFFINRQNTIEYINHWEEKITNHINPILLFTIGSLLCSTIIYTILKINYFIIFILFVLFIIMIHSILNMYLMNFLFTLMLIKIIYDNVILFFMENEIHYGILLFVLENKNSKYTEKLIENNVKIIKQTLDKYINYCEQNKLPVELLKIGEFLKFIDNIYLKDSNEPIEHKNIMNDFLNNQKKHFLPERFKILKDFKENNEKLSEKS